MTNQAYELDLHSVGQDVIIWPLAKILSPEVISIGDSSIINDFVFLAGGCQTDIGNFVHISTGVVIDGGGTFVMEDFATIAMGSCILTGTDNFLGGGLMGPQIPGRFRNVDRSFVYIGKFAAVAANCTVLPGVTIHEGAVVGAGAVVLKDCEPWTIYVGVPAHPLRARPKEHMLELEAQLMEELFDANGHYIPQLVHLAARMQQRYR